MYQPRDAQEAWRLARSTEKAQTLFTEQGYSLNLILDEGLAGVYAVSNSKGSRYEVDMRAGTCDCPDFVQRGKTCKHQLGIELHLTRKPVMSAERIARRARLGIGA